LVTGDSDACVPTDVFPSAAAAADFLSSPRVLAWFAQNCVAQHPKLVPMPIGLDYHTIAGGGTRWWGPRATPTQQEAELLALRRTPTTSAPPYRAYANFHFNMRSRFGIDRRTAMEQIPSQHVYYEPRRTKRLLSWRRQRSHHRFVLSPHGNGLDCHRTWEALCLGCIPIVRTSPLDRLWAGLPVWIVDSWAQVTPEAMLRKAAELDDHGTIASVGSIPDNLLLKTWMDRIRHAGVPHRGAEMS
jgi:hypothetical protein